MKTTDFTNKQLLELYNNYKTMSELSKFFNINIQTLINHFNKRNIPFKKRKLYEVNDYFFDTYTPESCYWAGFLAADGGIEYNKNRITLELKKTDIEHIEKYKCALSCTANIQHLTKIDKRPEFKTGIYYSVKIRFNSKQMVKSLKENFNITSRKSKNLQFANKLLNHEYLNHYMRGLIDGDGSVRGSKQNSTLFLCGSKDIVETFKNVIVKKYNINESKYEIIITKNGLNRFSINNNLYNRQICDWLYNNEYSALKRKKEKALEIINFKTFDELCKDREIKIDKEIFLSLKLSHKNLAKYFNCSTATISRFKRKIKCNL